MNPNKNAATGAQPHLHRIRVGLAGWSYDDWNGIVYPSPHPRDFHEVTFLAQFFDTIEINTSFYQPLKPQLATHWIGLAAENPRFVFTAKMWQKFTHETGATAEDEKLVRAGFDPLFDAGKLGAVLLQFPFSFHHTPETLNRLKQLLHTFRDYPLVVEVRHSSWTLPEFYELLHERCVGFCNIDQPRLGKAITPSEHVTAAFAYVRLHGRNYDQWFDSDSRNDRYNYLYTDAELQGWKTRIDSIAAKAQKTFVIANNHFEGKAAVNALQLKHMLTGRAVDVPETLLKRYWELGEIATPSEKQS